MTAATKPDAIEPEAQGATLPGSLTSVVLSVCGWARLDPHINLINAGLTSLEAARIVVALQTAGIADVEIADIFEFPTIDSLAFEIQRRRNDLTDQVAASPLIRLAEGELPEPVFCVHGGNGRVSFMRPFFRRVADLAGVGAWGIEAVGLDGQRDPVPGVPAMARQYLDLITSVQPRGPYRLAGYCAGGEIAIEMASLLLQRGERVEFLGIVDPFAADHDGDQASDEELRRRRVGELVEHCVAAGFERDRVDPSDDGTWRSLASALASIGRMPSSAGPETVRGHVDVWLNNVRSLERYRRPRDLPPSHAFVASGHVMATDAVPQGASVHHFAAHHDYVFESDELAELFARALRTARLKEGLLQ